MVICINGVVVTGLLCSVVSVVDDAVSGVIVRVVVVRPKEKVLLSVVTLVPVVDNTESRVVLPVTICVVIRSVEAPDVMPVDTDPKVVLPEEGIIVVISDAVVDTLPFKVVATEVFDDVVL